PRRLADLRRLLDHERRLGWSVEDGFVTPGFASVAYPVLDHSARPIAAISVTFRHVCDGDRPCGRQWPEPAEPGRAAARRLAAIIGGRSGEWRRDPSALTRPDSAWGRLRAVDPALWW